MFTAEHLRRCNNIRVIASIAPASTPAEPAVALEPEQEELFAELVDATRGVPRTEQEFLLVDTDQGDLLMGPGGTRSVLGHDVNALARAGFLESTHLNYASGNTYVISTKGRRHYADIHHRTSEPFAPVEQRVQSYLDSPDFRSAYAGAYARWHAAAELLWSADGSERSSTIGHETREAMQDFATALVDRYHPLDVGNDPTKTKDRVSAVLRMHRPEIGEKRTKLLDALYSYWSATVDLVQRQTHAGQKEGESLDWEDARCVVFQTANVMIEIDRAIRAAATLASASDESPATS